MRRVALVLFVMVGATGPWADDVASRGNSVDGTAPVLAVLKSYSTVQKAGVHVRYELPRCRQQMGLHRAP